MITHLDSSGRPQHFTQGRPVARFQGRLAAHIRISSPLKRGLLSLSLARGVWTESFGSLLSAPPPEHIPFHCRISLSMERDLALGCSQTLNTAVVRASHLQNASRQAVPSRLQWKQSSIGNAFQKSRWLMPRVGKTSLRHCVVKSDMTASAATAPAAPLLLETPSGQFLAELLQSHPYLVCAAAEQQLETLAEARDAAATSQEQSSPMGTEMILYKRIAELKAQERCKALEDIMYALICEKFVEAGISFVPQISKSSKNQRVDTWLPQDDELESVHSFAALELIREHLNLVLGGRGSADTTDQKSTAQISKLRMGRAYAASAVYGYFIRRVDKRFQLEKTIANSTAQLIEMERTHMSERGNADHNDDVCESEKAEEVTALVLRSESKQVESSTKAGRHMGMSSGRLRTYVMSFDQKTLQRYANLRSKESASVIERHTEALFGKPEIKITPEGTVAIAKDEVIVLSFSGLRRLVLEAVAFGSYLWDVETCVDTHYNFVAR
ncbi:hypothetical protein GOP47_0011349 [Adiantum capillus-veneris]|uniref:Uncharacterized protein n=1 Tax=Adiantum capillus-veneris TaxID=13818 RepID=A0A9D4UT38_ADICA|nr:hypothetical protein GOP47_0011349 [Adiantum capillus-veneris]